MATCTYCQGTGKQAFGRYCSECNSGVALTAEDYVRRHLQYVATLASLDAQHEASLRTTHGKNGIPEMRAVDAGSDEAACVAEGK